LIIKSTIYLPIFPKNTSSQILDIRSPSDNRNNNFFKKLKGQFNILTEIIISV